MQKQIIRALNLWNQKLSKTEANLDILFKKGQILGKKAKNIIIKDSFIDLIKIIPFTNYKQSLFVPVKIWNSSWKLPSKFKFKRSEGNRNHLMLYSKVDKIDRMKKFWHKHIPYIIKDKEIWVKILGKWPFFISIPKYWRTEGNFLGFETEKDDIGIYNIRKTGIDFCVFKRHTYLNEEFAECIGLYHAEGSGDKRRKHWCFTNSEITIINKMILWLRKFGINRNGIFIRIQSRNYKKSNKLNRYWSRKLKISTKQFYKPNKPGFGKKDTIHIYLNNKIFRRLCDKLCDILMPIILTNKSLCLAYLRGIFAGEGTLHTRPKQGTPDKLYVTAYKPLLRNYSCLLLKKLEITPRVTFRDIIIEDWNEFVKLDLQNFFKLHPEKNDKFREAILNMNPHIFLNNKARKKLLNFNTREVAEMLDVTNTTVSDWLVRDVSIPLDKLKKLAKMRGVSFHFLSKNTKQIIFSNNRVTKRTKQLLQFLWRSV